MYVTEAAFQLTVTDRTDITTECVTIRRESAAKTKDLLLRVSLFLVES